MRFGNVMELRKFYVVIPSKYFSIWCWCLQKKGTAGAEERLEKARARATELQKQVSYGGKHHEVLGRLSFM